MRNSVRVGPVHLFMWLLVLVAFGPIVYLSLGVLVSTDYTALVAELVHYMWIFLALAGVFVSGLTGLYNAYNLAEKYMFRYPALFAIAGGLVGVYLCVMVLLALVAYFNGS
jgi:hypothetical protein